MLNQNHGNANGNLECQSDESDFFVFNENTLFEETTIPNPLGNMIINDKQKVSFTKVGKQKQSKKLCNDIVSSNSFVTKDHYNLLINPKKSQKICFCSKCGRLIFNENDNNLTLEQFIEYLNFKINGEKNKKIPKEALYVLYEHLQYFLNLSYLTRDDKRIKNKIYMKLYAESLNIIFCLENMPHLFLDPVLIHLKSKTNNKKKGRQNE